MDRVDRYGVAITAMVNSRRSAVQDEGPPVVVQNKKASHDCDLSEKQEQDIAVCLEHARPDSFGSL